MPNPGDTKTLTAPMYKNEVIAARNTINSYQDYTVPTFLSWAGSFLGFVPGAPILAIVGSAAALAYGITITLASDHLEAQEDLYTGIIEEMLQYNLIYIDVRQRYVYIRNGKGEGWVLDGQPTITRHYTDY